MRSLNPRNSMAARWLGLVFATLLLATPVLLGSHGHDDDRRDECVTCTAHHVNATESASAPSTDAPITDSERVDAPYAHALPVAPSTTAPARAPPSA